MISAEVNLLGICESMKYVLAGEGTRHDAEQGHRENAKQEP